MTVEVQIPSLGESVTEGVIVRWIKEDGARVVADEPLFELETDKASVEIPAPSPGVLAVLAQEGQTVRVGEVVARIDPDGARLRAEPDRSPAPDAGAPAIGATSTTAVPHLPAGDALAHLDRRQGPDLPAASAAPQPPTPYPPLSEPTTSIATDEVERVPMTRLRQRIAARLRQAQATAAILTTFNEIDMSAVTVLRARFKARFADVHGVSLGFMSFFARACVAALKELPVINARIDGSDVVYHKRVHLGIAVGTERGLVVPVAHNADQLDFAGLEREIARLAGLARDNQLSIADLSGGTFTISNGGVYGSLLSTPILNPPQSAILGMHKIQPRPVVVDEQIVARPMMYVALSYDHRLIDGAEAVTFLIKVKERLEDPSRLLLGI